jgi:DNA-directed RNA polymerase specialized sigma24 family protein
MTAAVRDELPEADHVTRLYRLARGLCGPRAAEELTYEAYARVLATSGSRSAIEFPALASALLDGRDDDRCGEHIGAPVGRPGNVYAAVAALSADLRDTVALVDLAGMSHADAARVLRVPRVTMMTRLHRARTRVAGALAPAG